MPLGSKVPRSRAATLEKYSWGRSLQSPHHRSRSRERVCERCAARLLRSQPRGKLFIDSHSDMKNITRIVLVVALGFLNGCGTTTHNTMTGTWTFTLTPTAPPSQAIQVTADLTQINNSFFGQVTLTGDATACGTTAQMSGIVNGNVLSSQITQAQTAITLTGKTNSTLSSSSGTFTASSGQCILSGGTGTFAGFLQAHNTSSFDAKSD